MKLSNVALLFLIAIGCPVLATQQQSLHYSAIPSVTTYQLGKSTPVADIASLSDGSGTIKFSSPYSLSNSSGQQRILVKTTSDLPSSMAIRVSIDQPSGVISDGPVSMDGTDRSLVSNLLRGSYTGQLHYAIDGEFSSKTRGTIKVLYTLNAS